MENKAKEDAMRDYCSMIKESWTWAKLTAKERARVMQAIQNCNDTALFGTYAQRWGILQSVYHAVLLGIGYDSCFWRDDKKAVKDTFSIESLYASAWENAIDNTANLMASMNMGGLTRRDNWELIENFANGLGDVFDIDGELVR